MKQSKGLTGFGLTVALGVLLTGCASYRITSDVPEELRTIAVAVFENETGYPETSTIVTQYTLREFQREGTMKIKSWSNEDSSLKLQGVVKRGEMTPVRYDRSYGSRAAEYRYTLTAEITLVERSTGKLLLDAVEVQGSTTFLTYDDMLTGMQNSYPRIAKELSRAIVDTVLATWAPRKEE
jgi:outer membrane lipopolysaccharide assembly protein LptE/RlpB